MDSRIDIFGVMGKPAGHSLSPLMHNFAFNLFSLDAVYTIFEPVNLKIAVSGIRELGIKGASVTIPYKESVVKYLDLVSESAEKIGAVNTIINNNGVLEGDNTDWTGFVKAIEEHIAIKGKKILVLGAGGSARAVSYAVCEKGGDLFISNRTFARGKFLADEFSGVFVESKDLIFLNPDIIVNTTPVGMFPDIEKSPVAESVFQGKGLAFDLVYNPVETNFLHLAGKHGFKTVSGISMLVYQGQDQFFRWTGKKFPAQIVKEKIFKKLYQMRGIK